jgi:chaperone BCS1
MVVQRKRQSERAAGLEVLETVELTTIGRSAAIMHEIVREARNQAAERDSDHTIIFHNTGGRWSRQQEPRARRPLQSVVLAGDTRAELLCDVKQFLASRAYYVGLGVPYRRGYLLHGPPGCGKSSLVTALAGELRLAICVLSLSNRSLDDDSLNNLLNTAPLRSIVLLEDIDRAFANDSRITMSGLLNALDGVAAQEGRLVFMTTNHVDKLDAALVRPGRCDVKLEIGLMNSAQIRDMFVKFFPAASKAEMSEFVAAVPPNRLSPAQLQSHLFLHRESTIAATRAVEHFVQQQEQFEKHVHDKRKREAMQRKMMEGIMAPPIL